MVIWEIVPEHQAENHSGMGHASVLTAACVGTSFFASSIQLVDLGPDLGPPLRGVFLLLVQQDPEDVGGDGRADQCHPDLKHDVDRELAERFGHEVEGG